MIFLSLPYTQTVLKSTTFFGLRGFRILFTTMICSSAAFAFSSIPNRADRWVNDTARIINSSDEARLRAVLRNTTATTGDEITVATIDSQQRFSSGTESWEVFATRWFNTWRIGSSKTNRGVLILVALNDRRVRVELGRGFSRAYDGVMKCVIDSSMIPRFKQDDYAAGILNGANAVIKAIQARYAPCPAPFAVASKPQISSKPQVYVPVKPQTFADTKPVVRDANVNKPKPATLPLGWLFGGCGVLILGSLLPGLFKPRVKKCEQCQQPMQKLDEQSDNEYLEDGQQLEEVLKSVNYNVWQCTACNHRSIVRHSAWFSNYGDCPSCSRKTLFSDRQTLIAPTHFCTGKVRVLRDCKHCHFQDSHEVITPQLQVSSSSSRRSSSSRSSSSGGSKGGSGGSSSGGGASGSW